MEYETHVIRVEMESYKAENNVIIDRFVQTELNVQIIMNYVLVNVCQDQ